MTTVSGSIVDKIKENLENTGLERFDASRLTDKEMPSAPIKDLGVSSDSTLVGKVEISDILSKKLNMR